LNPLRQLRLIVVGATIGAICGTLVVGTSDVLRPVAITVAAGAILFGFTFPMQWLASQRVPRLARAHSSRIGRVVVTLAAALSVVLVFNVLVAPDARSVPARRNAQATVGPVPAVPSQTPRSIAPSSSAGPVAPPAPASPQPAVRPPTATEPTSSAPRATVVPVSSPAATSAVSPFATPASPQSPPPSAATAAPVQTVAPATPQAATPQPATPQPTPVSSPPSIVPTLGPLPTLPIHLP
jgi:hypothetical protein